MEAAVGTKEVNTNAVNDNHANAFDIHHQYPIEDQKKVNYDDDNGGDYFAMYKSSDGREVTSSVIVDVTTWSNASFLVPHEPCKSIKTLFFSSSI